MRETRDPTEADVEWALEVERCVMAGRKRFPYSSHDRVRKVKTSYTGDIHTLYMECLNNRPVSARTELRDVRDGCILTGGVFCIFFLIPNDPISPARTESWR